jgi:hypothetical protein
MERQGELLASLNLSCPNNADQQNAYNNIMNSIDEFRNTEWDLLTSHWFHFICGPGRMGKSALFRMLHAACLSKGLLIAICAVTSLAALLFDGAVTAHSLFVIWLSCRGQRRCWWSQPNKRIRHQRKQTNMKCQECRWQFFGILDCEKENRYLLDEDEEICPICLDILGTEIELGKMICSCTARFHYRCLVQYARRNPEYNPFLNNGIKCVTCNGIAEGIERITRNRH